MKWENWESPVNIIETDMRTKFDGEIMKAIQEVGISVDKEELLKCMQYDREQYEKGYEQGRADAIDEFAHALKETFNNEFPSNYHCTQPYFTLDNVRVLVDLVVKEQNNG